MIKADLHIHSNYSDGQDSPEDILKIAKEQSIKVIALTDHNTTKGIEEISEKSKKFGIRVIPAVEIKVDCGEILAYFIDPKNDKLQELLYDIRSKFCFRVEYIFRQIKKSNIPITWQDILKYYPHADYNANLSMLLYPILNKELAMTMDGAIDYLQNNNIKIPKMQLPGPVEVIKTIIEAGGVPVLAHPWLKKGILEDEKKIKLMIDAGLKGMELNNGDGEPARTKEDENMIKEYAKKYNLLLTAGSDYHSKQLNKYMFGNHSIGNSFCDLDKIPEIKKKIN